MEIVLNKPVIREAVIRALSDANKEQRQAEFVISTEAIDSYGTVFRADGWDLKRYMANPIVCFQHRSSSDNPDMILGTSEVRIENNQLIATVTFESAEDNPLAEKVWRKVKNGTLRMASVGANPTSGHWGERAAGEDPEVLYFDNSELYEWSIVSMGSNPDALKRNAESMEAIRASIIKEIPEIEKPETKTRSMRATQLIINSNSLK
jgi:HK97 family phage prohead protease